ncbi:MAG: hypothetical protein ACT4QE_00495 [Anaerolineales bacterium]
MTIDIDDRKVQRRGFSLWLSWTLATAAGMVLGFAPFALFVYPLELLWVRWLIPLWAGVWVGLLQWAVLRGYLTHSVDWVWGGGAGWALGYALGLLVIQTLADTGWGVLLGYVLFGLIIAVLQGPVLRREIPGALPWAVASAIGWAAGAYGGQLAVNVFNSGEPPDQLIVAAVIALVTGLIAGAITGLALVWIVRQPDVEVRPAVETGGQS